LCRCGSVVEQLIRNQQATGSNPVIGFYTYFQVNRPNLL
jgi:hypothetical protein